MLFKDKTSAKQDLLPRNKWNLVRFFWMFHVNKFRDFSIEIWERNFRESKFTIRVTCLKAQRADWVSNPRGIDRIRPLKKILKLGLIQERFKMRETEHPNQCILESMSMQNLWFKTWYHERSAPFLCFARIFPKFCKTCVNFAATSMTYYGAVGYSG